MLGRFVANGRIYEGSFEIDDNLIIFDGYEVPLSVVKFLPPVIPTKIIAVGLNYIDHAEELNMPVPEEPILFMKPSTAVRP